MAHVTAEDVRKLMATLNEPKALLRAAVDRITLDPETLDCQVHYRVSMPNRVSLASPTGRAAWPVLMAVATKLPDRVKTGR